MMRWRLRQHSTARIIHATGGRLPCNTNGARNVRATAPDAISFDFVVTDHLWGLSGATARIGAVMVPPRQAKAAASPMSPPVIASCSDPNIQWCAPSSQMMEGH
jgi:hypothetical protein